MDLELEARDASLNIAELTNDRQQSLTRQRRNDFVLFLN